MERSLKVYRTHSWMAHALCTARQTRECVGYTVQGQKKHRAIHRRSAAAAGACFSHGVDSHFYRASTNHIHTTVPNVYTNGHVLHCCRYMAISLFLIWCDNTSCCDDF